MGHIGQPAINGLGQHSKLIGNVLLISALTAATFLISSFFIILGRYLPRKVKSQKELHRSNGCFRNGNMLKTEPLSLELLVTFSELLPHTAILTHFTEEEM